MSNVASFSFSDLEVFSKLQEIQNKSGLIQDLLRDYFKINTKNIEDINNQILSIEDQRKKILDKLELDKNSLITHKEQIQKQTEKIETLNSQTKEKENKVINSIKQNFNDYMKREMLDDELNDYLFRLDNEKGFNFFRFIQDKGFVFEEETINNSEL